MWYKVIRNIPKIKPNDATDRIIKTNKQPKTTAITSLLTH